MSMLKKRIRKQGRDHPEWQQAVPAGTPVPPGQPGLLTVSGEGVSYTSLNPLYAADNGAPFPAKGPGGTDQLYAAGRP